jgi:hypothetical protein
MVLNVNYFFHTINSLRLILVSNHLRWGQPTQQQGRLMPLLSLDMPTLMRRTLVSSCLAEVTQHIHSLRAKGVMSAQVTSTFGVAISAFCKSRGILWTVPPEIFLEIVGIYFVRAFSKAS